MGRRSIAVVVLGMGVLLAGISCREQPATEVVAKPAPAMPQEFTIHARDFAFTAPDTLTAGMTTIHLVNDGPGLHHAQLLWIDSGKTTLDAMTEIPKAQKFPAWLVPVGGPNAANPGDTITVSQNLIPGNYVWICFVDMPGGVPHYKEGMFLPLTVVQAPGASAPAPTADINVSLRSFAFDFSAPLTAGRHTFMVTTADTSAQSHELVMVRLAPGKTGQDLLNYIQKPDGPPPGRPIAGVSDVTAHMPVYFTADITPGDYLLICFLPDATDGKPHFMHGMMQTVHVS